MTGPDPTGVDRWSRWLSTWTVVSLPGVGLAIVAWDPAMVVGLAASVAVLASVMTVLAEPTRRRGGSTPPGLQGRRSVGRVALCATCVVISVAVLGVFVPGIAALVLVVAGASSPLGADLGRRMSRWQSAAARSAPEAGQMDSLPCPLTPRSDGSADEVRRMSDAALCRAWRHSYWALRDARDPLTTLDAVVQRQRVLDELECRNAAALQAWLLSGARASTGLERFVIPDRRDGDGHDAVV